MDDAGYAQRMTAEVLLDIAHNYFSAQLEGDWSFLREYGQRPIILVGNHAGSGMSWDNVMFSALLSEKIEQELGHFLPLDRLVYAGLTEDRIQPFLIRQWWRRMHCHRIDLAKFADLCAQRKLIFISPEGIHGIAKGYAKRNQVQTFSSSFIHMAKKYDALIVPVAMIHSEYLLPFSYFHPRTNQLALTTVGLPYFPLQPLVAFIAAPAYYIAALPARLHYKVLPPIDSRELSPDNSRSNRLEAEEIRWAIQQEVTKNDRGFWRGIHFGRLFGNPWSSRRLSVHNLYLKFWEAELGRRLTSYEKARFFVPVLGHRLIRKWRDQQAVPLQ